MPSAISDVVQFLCLPQGIQRNIEPSGKACLAIILNDRGAIAANDSG